MMIWRCHLPIWKTIGMFVPAGTSVIVSLPSENLPASSDFVMTTGFPDSSDVPVLGSHGSQLGPSLKGARVSLGT
jgi:hypothetical protein